MDCNIYLGIKTGPVALWNGWMSPVFSFLALLFKQKNKANPAPRRMTTPMDTLMPMIMRFCFFLSSSAWADVWSTGLDVSEAAGAWTVRVPVVVDVAEEEELELDDEPDFTPLELCKPGQVVSVEPKLVQRSKTRLEFQMIEQTLCTQKCGSIGPTAIPINIRVSVFFFLAASKSKLTRH